MQGISLLYAVKEEGLRLFKFYQFITAWRHSSLVAIVCSKRVNICAKILPCSIAKSPPCLQSSYGADSVEWTATGFLMTKTILDELGTHSGCWPLWKVHNWGTCSLHILLSWTFSWTHELSECPQKNPLWEKASKMHTVQLLSQSTCFSEKSHFETRWGENTSLQPMWILNSILQQS